MTTSVIAAGAKVVTTPEPGATMNVTAGGTTLATTQEPLA